MNMTSTLSKLSKFFEELAHEMVDKIFFIWTASALLLLLGTLWYSAALPLVLMAALNVVISFLISFAHLRSEHTKR